MTQDSSYPARLQVDYPQTLDRLSTFLRFLYILPILLILGLLSGGGGPSSSPQEVDFDEVSSVLEELGIESSPLVDELRHALEQQEGERSHGTLGTTGGLFFATLLMLLFRGRYPRWWFEFWRELTRFGGRVAAYGALLTDVYPSTVDEQHVHLELDYPNAAQLNRWLPLVKWFLAIPHFIVLAVLAFFAVLAILGAWFAILFTGRYPRPLFEFVVGVGRWSLRVHAYAFLLLTDQYPPFSLE